MTGSISNARFVPLAFAAALSLVSLSAQADGGFYLGGSVGGATIEAEFDTADFPELPASLDEDDTAFKVFVGYKLDLPVIDLGVEGGYVSLGEPEIEIDTVFGTQQVGLETTGLNVWGTAGLEVGPVDVFGKLGFISWDVEAGIDGFDSASDDGTDMGYGLGVSFDLGSIQLRGEYEVYDIDDADVEMLSVGIAFRF